MPEESRLEAYEQREKIYQQKRRGQKRRREREQFFKVRLMQGMLCFCLVAVSVATVVMAVDRIKGE